MQRAGAHARVERAMSDETRKVTVNLPLEIYQEARQIMAKVPGATMKDAVVILMRKGLGAPRAALIAELKSQLADKPTSED